MNETNKIPSAIQFLSSSKSEHKVVGIILINDVLSEYASTSTQSVEDLVGQVLELTGASFIIQMIETEDDQGKSIQVQQAGANFMLTAISYKQHAAAFLSHATELVASAIKLIAASIKEQCTMSLKLLSMMCGKKGKDRICTAILEYGKAEPSASVLCLQLLTEIATAEGDNVSKAIVLFKSHCEILQGLVIRGLRGAALQSERDLTLHCLALLLAPPTTAGTVQHQYCLAPTWTVETSGTQEGSFPQLLCAMVRGELQLLSDELLFLVSNTPQSVAERFSLPVPPRSDLRNKDTAHEKDGKSSTVDESVSPPPPSAAAVDTPVEVAADKIAADVRFFETRVSRTLAQFCACLRLFTAFLDFLIGSQIQNESNTEQPPCWSVLPTPSLLQLKRSLYGTVTDLLAFIKDSAAELPGIEAGSGAFMGLEELRSAVCCAVDALTVYAVQDAELLDSFLQHLPSILLCSHLTLHKGKDRGVTDISVLGVEVEALVHLVQEFRAGGMSLALQLMQRNHETEVTARDTDTVKAVTDRKCMSEVTLHLQEMLNGVLSASSAQSSAEESEGLVLDGAVLERLFDSYEQLMPRLLHLFRLCAASIQNLLQSGASIVGTDSDSVILLLMGITDLACLINDLAQCRESSHEGELESLRQAEGDVALYDALGLQATELRAVLQLLQEVGTTAPDSIPALAGDGSNRDTLKGLAYECSRLSALL